VRTAATPLSCTPTGRTLRVEAAGSGSHMTSDREKVLLVGRLEGICEYFLLILWSDNQISNVCSLKTIRDEEKL